MGNIRIKWVTGAALATIVAGLLVLGVINYFRGYAHAEVNQAGNLQKNQPENLTVEKEQSTKLVQVDKDTKAEMEWMRKHQMEAKKNEKQKETKTATEDSKPEAKPANENTKPAATPTKENTKPETKPTPTQENTKPTTTPIEEKIEPTDAGKKTVYLTFDDGPQVFSKEIIALWSSISLRPPSSCLKVISNGIQMP